MGRWEPTVTARTITWAPLGVTAAAALVAIVVADAIGAAGGVNLVAALSSTAIAVGAGWLIEDHAAELVGSTPRSLRRRYLDRLALGGAATAIAVIAVTIVAVTVEPDLRSELVTMAAAARLVAISVAVVALTAFLARRAVPQAALVAASSAAAGYVMWTILWGTPVTTTAAWMSVAALAGLGAFAASREPLPR